jgi:hypothetical protein
MRIATRATPDELNNLLQFARYELDGDLVDAPFMEQVNSRYYRLRRIFSDRPSH